ncbi:MAG: DUF6265 family protein [Rhodothalassiaceae bacterium]
MRYLLIWLMGSLPALAEDAAVDPAHLAWLQGCWVGEGLGAEVSECWMAAPDGRMTGMFQLVEDGAQRFSEIFVLDDFGDGPVLRLKHFDAELKGWEAQDGFISFRLIKTEPDRASFKGLVYERTADDAMAVHLDIRRADGSVRTETLIFQRAN